MAWVLAASILRTLCCNDSACLPWWQSLLLHSLQLGLHDNQIWKASAATTYTANDHQNKAFTTTMRPHACRLLISRTTDAVLRRPACPQPSALHATQA